MPIILSDCINSQKSILSFHAETMEPPTDTLFHMLHNHPEHPAHVLSILFWHSMSSHSGYHIQIYTISNIFSTIYYLLSIFQLLGIVG